MAALKKKHDLNEPRAFIVSSGVIFMIFFTMMFVPEPPNFDCLF